MLGSSAVLILPWLIALALTPRVIRWAHAKGFVDHPGGERKTHSEATPDVGGLAVFGSAALGLALVATVYEPVRQGFWGPGSLSVLGLGALAMLVLGRVDDKRDLQAPLKASVQIGIAALTWLAGFRVGAVELPAGFVLIDAALPSFVLTVGWIVVVTNAFNLIDGMDGLSTGVGLLALLTIFLLAADRSEAVPVLASLALAGSLAGFLRFNLPPARIFLGDSGALPLGYTAAVVAIATYQKSSAAMVIALPLLALGLPLLDVGLAILRRGLGHLRAHGLRGATPRQVMHAVFQADRGHIHHLLMRSGWTPDRILFSLYGVCALFAALAMLLRDLSSTVRWGVVAGAALAGLLALRQLGRRVQRLESDRAQERALSPEPEAPRRAAG